MPLVLPWDDRRFKLFDGEMILRHGEAPASSIPFPCAGR